MLSSYCLHHHLSPLFVSTEKWEKYQTYSEKGKGVGEIVAVPAETGKTGKENSRDCNNFEIIKPLFLSLQQNLDPGIIFCLKERYSALAVICEQWSASFSSSAMYSTCLFYPFCVYPQKQQLFWGNSLLPWLTSVNILCRNTNILGNL